MATGEVRGPRLTNQNAGAELSLRKGDLLVAQFFPLSNGVDVVKIIIGNEGEVEFGEYVVLPQESQRFLHLQFRLKPDAIRDIQREIESLCRLDGEINFDDIDCDFGEYEEPLRRLLVYWCSGKKKWLSLPSVDFFRDFGIADQLRDEVGLRFATAWDQVLQIVDDARRRL